MEPFVSAIVLAAGMSKRMGTLKQLAKVGDSTLLEAVLAAVKQSRIRETVLVLGYQAEAILEAVKIDSTTKVILNQSYLEGMSTSIQMGLGAVSKEAVAALIVLADQPLLKSAVIDRLVEEFERSGAAIVLPIYRGFRGNPVLIGRSLFAEMMQISGDIGCRSLFGLHPEQIYKVPVDDIGILVDVDTVQDLAKMHSIQGGGMLDLSSLQVDDRSLETIGHLLIIGKDEVASALAKLGKFLKFRVSVIDPLLTKTDLPEADSVLNELDLRKTPIGADTYIVIASHGKFDEEALEQAVGTEAGYIALVGSKKRGAELLQRLGSRGVSEEALRRIRCPAGLQIHAETPEEIALSILAEIVNLRRNE